MCGRQQTGGGVDSNKAAPVRGSIMSAATGGQWSPISTDDVGPLWLVEDETRSHVLDLLKQLPHTQTCLVEVPVQDITVVCPSSCVRISGPSTHPWGTPVES